MAEPRVLIASSDADIAASVNAALGGSGAEIVGVSEWSSALAEVEASREAGRQFDLVLVEKDLIGSAEAGTADLAQLGADPHVVVLTNPTESPDARGGPFDVMVKPPSQAELLARLDRARKNRDMEWSEDMRKPRKSDVIIGAGPWIKELYDQLSMAAPTDVTIAIYGESGTGKELIARTIHSLSRRHAQPFVVVNCAAIPEALLEDELFGHVRGAFTDAGKDREGLFAAANGGTIFLDEIGEMPLALQSKLLRVLQSREFRRVGSDEVQEVDVRVLAATNRDLEKAVADGQFREDLFYRINVFPIHLLPLRDRREDIPLLAYHFLRKHQKAVGREVEGFTPEALHRLSSHHFPGNVRELENRVHRALVMTTGPMIEEGDLDLDNAPVVVTAEVDLGRPFRDLKRQAIDAFERDYLARLLSEYHGNLAAAARAAGMDRKNLWAMTRKHGIDVDAYRRSAGKN